MREFTALLDRQEDERKWENWRAGLVASTIVNVNIDPEKHEPFSPQDFMPVKDGHHEAPPMTEEEKAQATKRHFIAVTQAMGGEVKRQKLDLEGRWVDVR